MLQAFTLMFTLGLVVAGARLLVKSAQPGQSERASLIVIGMLFLAQRVLDWLSDARACCAQC